MRAAAAILLLVLAIDAFAIEAGGPAPPLTARLSDGSEFVLEKHRGEVVIVDFWACWCEPCQEELKALQALHERYGSQGLTVLAINVDDAEDRRKVDAIADGLPFAHAVARDVDAQGYGRIWRLPITFVIDRKGVLRDDGGAGPRRRYDLPGLEAMIQPLLAERP